MRKFKWFMTEEDFKRLQSNLNTSEWVSDNAYRGVAIGDILVEFITEDIEGRNILIDNGYVISKDSGYGELEDGTEYDLIDGVLDLNNLVLDKTFIDFIYSVEKEFNRIIATEPNIRKYAETGNEYQWYTKKKGNPMITANSWIRIDFNEEGREKIIEAKETIDTILNALFTITSGNDVTDKLKSTSYILDRILKKHEAEVK